VTMHVSAWFGRDASPPASVVSPIPRASDRTCSQGWSCWLGSDRGAGRRNRGTSISGKAIAQPDDVRLDTPVEDFHAALSPVPCPIGFQHDGPGSRAWMVLVGETDE
jgi:hypothetical protein